jgi:hypothetical protein
LAILELVVVMIIANHVNEFIQNRIYEVRGQRVMFDFDLAFTEHGVTNLAVFIMPSRTCWTMNPGMGHGMNEPV